MIRLSLISTEGIGCEDLSELRRYASVPEESQDALLRKLMLRAAVAVQEYADESVIPCTFRLTVTDNTDTEVKLYQSVSEVVSVEGASSWSLSGRILTLKGASGTVTVTYRTQPEEGERQRLMPVVLRYATALYDGLGSDELSAIVREVY